MITTTIEELCKVLHEDCYGSWHSKDSYKYRDQETHHPLEHMFMAQRLMNTLNSKVTVTPCC